jgi:hypothetical protein
MYARGVDHPGPLDRNHERGAHTDGWEISAVPEPVLKVQQSSAAAQIDVGGPGSLLDTSGDQRLDEEGDRTAL